MSTDHWILDENGKPKKVDLMTWAQWFETADRIVRQEWIGDIWVSTVFLGLDHNLSNRGPPILWETMAFSNRKIIDQWCDRCAGTKEQAEAMHERVVKEACKIEQIEYKPERQQP